MLDSSGVPGRIGVAPVFRPCRRVCKARSLWKSDPVNPEDAQTQREGRGDLKRTELNHQHPIALSLVRRQDNDAR